MCTHCVKRFAFPSMHHVLSRTSPTDLHKVGCSGCERTFYDTRQGSQLLDVMSVASADQAQHNLKGCPAALCPLQRG